MKNDKTKTIATIKAKEKERKEIEKLTNEYLKKGKTIKILPPFVCSENLQDN